jgi:hypothetical protein
MVALKSHPIGSIGDLTRVLAAFPLGADMSAKGPATEVLPYQNKKPDGYALLDEGHRR